MKILHTLIVCVCARRHHGVLQGGPNIPLPIEQMKKKTTQQQIMLNSNAHTRTHIQTDSFFYDHTFTFNCIFMICNLFKQFQLH